jgi:spoIIIJ-associated protein
VDVSLEEAGLVIGQGGEHLRMWEEVIQKKLNQHSEERYRISVDINNYRFEYEEKLREVARVAAKRVSVTKQPVKLQPMNAYERRVVHAELALRPDIVTESEGAEPRRCVVVKLIS